MPLVKKEELQSFIDDDYDITMGVFDIQNPFGYGRVVTKNSLVEKIVEQKDGDKKTLEIKTVNSGVYLFKKNILDEYLPKISNNNNQKEYYLTDIVGLCAEDNKQIRPLFVNPDSFLGVNSKVDLSHAEDIMLNNIREEHMKNGVIMRMPQTIYIEKSVKIEGESIIDNGCSLIGKTTIIDSHIKINSIVESAIIKESTIGPMARIRPESDIKNSHIGNFVETKKALLNGIKSGHLTYLGDVNIDSGTNIGAGTIVCNYDGKKKHKSTIGKNVFVGSNTKLISPVNIEDDVMIGAGSTITKDISKGELAINRTPTKIVKDFYYKFFGRA
jgi:bifunctional UDP-N-acetylglucosamine pyrophosphorylase/glucosamine-1-phosphate N-acetyltransferase